MVMKYKTVNTNTIFLVYKHLHYVCLENSQIK